MPFSASLTRQNIQENLSPEDELLKQQIKEKTVEKFGIVPYDWQVTIALAAATGNNAVLIAGTGSGKTFPIAMSSLVLDEGFVLVLSPLNALQQTQVHVV